MLKLQLYHFDPVFDRYTSQTIIVCQYHIQQPFKFLCQVKRKVDDEPVFERPSACAGEHEPPPLSLKQTQLFILFSIFSSPFFLRLYASLTLSLVLEHLEELLDALVPRGESLLLRVNPHLQLLVTGWGHMSKETADLGVNSCLQDVLGVQVRK